MCFECLQLFTLFRQQCQLLVNLIWRVPQVPVHYIQCMVFILANSLAFKFFSMCQLRIFIQQHALSLEFPVGVLCSISSHFWLNDFCAELNIMAFLMMESYQQAISWSYSGFFPNRSVQMCKNTLNILIVLRESEVRYSVSHSGASAHFVLEDDLQCSRRWELGTKITGHFLSTSHGCVG